MAQSIFFPPHMHAYTGPAGPVGPLGHTSVPSSPDPTPLRMLAFSVAEAALQSDPNSPMFVHAHGGKVPSPPSARTSGWVPAPAQPQRASGGGGGGGGGGARWTTTDDGRGRLAPVVDQTVSGATRRGQQLWHVVGKAKERRVSSSYTLDAPPSPPASPGYNFTLPPNSPLAESIAADASSPRLHPRFGKTRPAALDIAPTRSFPLYTRSAEPSPIDSTFAGLDQTRPPPEFVPRLTAEEFSLKSSKIAETTKARHARTQSDADSPDLVSPVGAIFPAQPLPSSLPRRGPAARPSRHTQRLPSLQQIQAQMKRGHRRTGSAGAMEMPTPKPASVPASTLVLEREAARMTLEETGACSVPTLVTSRRPTSARKDSEESIVLQTPEDDVPNPLRDRRRALQVIMNRRPATPPSPGATAGGKESFLPFLRERTSDRHRLAIVKGEGDYTSLASTTTTPPPRKPVLRVTPPSYESRAAVPPLVLAPEALSYSPSRPSFFRRATSPTTPTATRFTPPARLSTPPSIRAIAEYRSVSGSGAGAGAGGFTSAPASPTDSLFSRSTTNSPGAGIGSRADSPTPSMPIITCTPAPPTVLRDGIEHDSDGESEPDVIVFDGEAEEREREERERRGSVMLARLGARRRSID